MDDSILDSTTVSGVIKVVIKDQVLIKSTVGIDSRRVQQADFAKFMGKSISRK